MSIGKSNHFRLKRGGVGRAYKHAAYVIGREQYASREDVACTGMGNMPSWAQDDPLAFWAAADAHERANGRAYHEFEAALPRELSIDQCRALVDGWLAQELGNRHPYLYSIHIKLAADGQPQPHLHCMFTDRVNDGIDRPPELFFKRAAARYKSRKTGELVTPDPATGGAGKDRRWNDREIVKALRTRWQDHCNGVLGKNGHQPRMDLRSNAERGLDAPEPKIGPAHHRKGGDKWREARAEEVQATRKRRRRQRERKGDIHDLKAELRAARRAQAQENVSGAKSPEQQGQRKPYRTPLQLLTPEARADRTVYRWTEGKAAGYAALVDRGSHVTLAGKACQAKARALVELCKTKGWTGLTLTGSEEFKRLAIREALRAGVRVANPELTTLVATVKQEIESECQNRKQQHRAGAAKRAFAPWTAVPNGQENRPGLQTGEQLGPKRMPTLSDPSAGDGQPAAGDPLLLSLVQGPHGLNSGLHELPAGGADDMTMTLDECHTLAREWVMTSSSISPAEAHRLLADRDALLEIFAHDEEARRWELIRSQRASGVPEALLGYRIARDGQQFNGKGTVRHVGIRAWIEPLEHPGTVLPVPSTQRLRPGQRVVAVQRDGETIVIPEQREYTPTPR